MSRVEYHGLPEDFVTMAGNRTDPALLHVDVGSLLKYRSSKCTWHLSPALGDAYTGTCLCHLYHSLMFHKAQLVLDCVFFGGFSVASLLTVTVPSWHCHLSLIKAWPPTQIRLLDSWLVRLGSCKESLTTHRLRDRHWLGFKTARITAIILPSPQNY